MQEILTGIDILEIERFRTAKFFTRIAEFILTGSELLEMEKSPDQPRYLATRFAAKEAVVKALPEEVSMLDFEIIKNGLKPAVRPLKPSLNRYSFSISLSHSESFAAASAVVLLR